MRRRATHRGGQSVRRRGGKEPSHHAKPLRKRDEQCYRLTSHRDGGDRSAVPAPDRHTRPTRRRRDAGTGGGDADGGFGNSERGISMTKTFLLIPAAIWLAGGGGAPPEKRAASAAPAMAVSTVTAATETWPSTYEAAGTVRARTSAVISAKLTGYVREVRVQAGDRVREGQMLVTLDTRDLDIGSRRAEAAREEVRTAVPEADGAVAAAKANLDLAQVTFGRMQDLFQKKSISNQEFDESSARLKSAQAAHEMAQARRVQLNSKLAQVDQEVRAAVDHRTRRRLPPRNAGGRVPAGGDSGGPAGVGHLGWRRSHARCAGFRNRACGGCRLAGLHR